MAVLFGGIWSWRIFLAEAVNPKHGVFSTVIQYDGNVLAVGGFSFFGGNTLAVGGIKKIWRYLPGPPTRAVISPREKYRRPP